MKFFRLVILAVTITFGTIQSINAQKIAVVDIANLLDNMPDYLAAQKTLDEQAESWRSEISAEMNLVKGMYNKFQAESVLMSDEMKKKKEESIINKEKQVYTKQQKYFGQDGELFKKRQELVQPIQEKVYTAIETYATERGYDIILDKNSSAGIIFANNKYDKTNDIKSKLKI